MNARPKKKICWNCEGNVSVKAETCPYCGVSVAGLSSDISPETPIAPYRLVNPAQESPIPVSPYLDEEDAKASYEDEDEDSNDELVGAASDSSHGEDDSKKVVLVLTLLLGGSIFLVFGFALLLFSSDGYLSLHWDASYWFIYLLLALPMLFFGFRKLNVISDKI